MGKFVFSSETPRVLQRIGAAELRQFAVPHLVVDDLFSTDLIRAINDFWPDNGAFQPEAPGNYVIQLYPGNFRRIGRYKRTFWKVFNKRLWPAICGAVAQAFEPQGMALFGGLYRTHLSLDWPLTLMQATPDYNGLNAHTHFYHAPYWVFTVLIYVDPQETCSNGTALRRIPTQNRAPMESSYNELDLDRLTDVAMGDAGPWDNEDYEMNTIDYVPGRMFAMLDGPLALHYVPFDKDDTAPSEKRKQNGGGNARRRILRCHARVHPAQFYDQHTIDTAHPLDPERYTFVMTPGSALSDADRSYRETIIRTFYRDRLADYAHAKNATAPVPIPDRPSWVHRMKSRILLGLDDDANTYERQFRRQIK